MREGIHVGLGEDASDPRAGLQTTGRNLFVETKRDREIHGIGIDLLAQSSQFVDERDLGGDEGGRGFTQEFSGFVVRLNNGDAAHNQ